MTQVSFRADENLNQDIEDFCSEYGVKKSDVLRFCLDYGFRKLDVESYVHSEMSAEWVMSGLLLGVDLTKLKEGKLA